MWRRWDLHIHTPGTLKNDQFKCDIPIDESTGTFKNISPENRLNLKWDKFYSTINDYIGDGSDINKAIEVIGITDYNSIENYKKVKSDHRLPSSVKMIIPNIEMRLSLISGKSPVNIHFLFDPSIDDEIEDRFLGKLKFTYGSSNYSAKKNELIRLGQKIDSGADENHAYHLGAEQYLVDFNLLQALFKEDADLRNHVLIVVANGGDDGLSGFGKKRNKNDPDEDKDVQRQTSAIREAVYKFVDALFTSNPSDVKHFLGIDGKITPENAIRTFGSLKPCVHGSDAHFLERLFEPDGQKYCWIKADSTFEGLKQIIYEPAERVYIGQEYPDLKDPHYTIRSVKFDDEKFQHEEIVFNPNLNCIIGGKSTGKTLLLQNMAKAIDPSHVDQQIKSLQINRTPLDVKDPVVTWMDGTSDYRKIVYIPQTFLNHSVEDNEGFSAKNEIIGDFLLQNPEIVQLHDKFDRNLSNIHTKTQDAIRSYFRNLRAMKKIDDELLKDGSESTFISLIKELNAKKDSLAEGADFPQEKWAQFSKLNNDFDDILKKEIMLQAEASLLEQIENPKVLIPGIIRRTSEGYENDFSQYPLYKEQLSSLIEKYEKIICSDWVSEIEKIKTSITTQKKQLDEQKKKIDADLSPLKQQSEKNKELHAVLEQIKIENKKLEVSKERSLKRKEYFDELTKSKSIILESTTTFKNEYTNYVTAIKAVKMNKDSSLKIQINYDFRKDGFNQFLESAFLKKMQEKTRNVIDFDFFSWTSENYNEENIKKIFDFIEKDFVESPDFIRKGNQYENILLQFFTNWFHIQYDVCLDGDSINQMSPGKKAAVYLELLIGLTDVKCPILIDQPEDDLDNRSIYHDLVEYIKVKKKERQIIIVTHNANLVLGADAEEVIIANKSVSETSNKSFEYRSGSIENNIADNASNNVLYKKGIQDQICDILEGGKTAFEHRKNKYLSIAD